MSDLKEKYLSEMIRSMDSRKFLADYHKDQFALEIAGQVMARISVRELPGGNVQLKAQIQLLILDAIEFGIQLGGMDWKEGE